jgi:tight adherence protein C
MTMALLAALVVFAAVGTAVVCFALAATAPAAQLTERLQQLSASEPEPQGSLRQPLRERLQRALAPLAKALPHSMAEVSQTRLWLVQAGYREERHLNAYFGLRALCAFLALAVVLGSGIGFRSVWLMVGLPAFGFFLPRFFLKRRITKRQSRIRLALPDALDLTVICVEAGISLDQAIQRVGAELQHAHPDLSEELRLVSLETRAGKPRPEALRNLATRTGVNDVRQLVAVLIQTDRFGTGIVQALRVHSDALRTERRQRAEEQAAKLNVKMLPYLVVFVFPALLVVVFGPAALQSLHILVNR